MALPPRISVGIWRSDDKQDCQVYWIPQSAADTAVAASPTPAEPSLPPVQANFKQEVVAMLRVELDAPSTARASSKIGIDDGWGCSSA